jgi:hypothetical protein
MDKMKNTYSKLLAGLVAWKCMVLILQCAQTNWARTKNSVNPAWPHMVLCNILNQCPVILLQLPSYHGYPWPSQTEGNEVYNRIDSHTPLSPVLCVTEAWKWGFIYIHKVVHLLEQMKIFHCCNVILFSCPIIFWEISVKIVKISLQC